MFHPESCVLGTSVPHRGFRGGTMKKEGFALLVFSFGGMAQQPPQPSAPAQTPVRQSKGVTVATTPTPSDLYCSGFITTEKIPEACYVVGGLNTPDQTQYGNTIDRIFVHGQGMKEGDRFEFIRDAKDPNHYNAFPGQKRAIRYAGEPYFELGYAKVIGVEKNIAILQPELSCASILPGDLAIPFVERPAPTPAETAVASPPTITCNASPGNIRPDESSTITCNATSPDNRPLTITFTSSAGTLSVNKNVAVLNSSNTGPGQVAVRATAVDDRQLSASANTTITVEPPPAAPTAQKMNDLDFKPNRAYVNNRTQTILDAVATKHHQ